MASESKARDVKPLQPQSKVEQCLDEQFRVMSDPLFIAAPTSNPYGLPTVDLGKDPFVAELMPVATRKVSGDGAWTFGVPELWATKIWPVAVYWALTGGQHSPVSPDTGVCVHPVPNPFDPDGEPAQVVTLMASWDHHWHGEGRVWYVPHSVYDFDNPDGTWIYRTNQRILLPRNIHVVPVSPRDLPFLPVECRPDETMLSVGAEPFAANLPKRGPHRPFDPAYACGVTGGSFMVVGKDIYAIGDSWLPLEKRHPEHNMRSNDRWARLLTTPGDGPTDGSVALD